MRIEFNNNTLIVLLYDDNNLEILLKTLAELEKMLCKRLSIDFNGASEVLIDVDDYYEYQSLKRDIYNHCPIYP